MASNMPPGCSDGGFSTDDEVKHVCKKCGTTKVLPMFYELGGWFYFTDQHADDAFCCDQEMEVEDA